MNLKIPINIFMTLLVLEMHWIKKLIKQGMNNLTLSTVQGKTKVDKDRDMFKSHFTINKASQP